MNINGSDIAGILEAVKKYVNLKVLLVLLFVALLHAFVIKPEVGFGYIDKWQNITKVKAEMEAFNHRVENYGSIKQQLEILRLRLDADVLIVAEFHNSTYSVGNVAPYLKISAKYVSPNEAKEHFVQRIKDRQIDSNGITTYILNECSGCALITREDLLQHDHSTWVSYEEKVHSILYHTFYIKGVATGQIIGIYYDQPIHTEKELIIELDKSLDNLTQLLYYTKD